jgi:hypothetical protein
VRENIRTAVQIHTLAIKSSLLREALAHHCCWIEETLGVPLADTIATFTDLPLPQLAITHLLGLPQSHVYRSQLRSLDPRVLSIATPTDRPPLLRVGMGSEHASKLASRRDRCLAEWIDTPIALHVHGLSMPVVALPLTSRLGPDSIGEDQDTVLIFQHSLAAEVLALLEQAELHERQPKLRVYQGATSDVRNAGWDDLVLDEQVNSLLRRDFETFFEREAWFRQHRLPFRRGYLLHGPPGNGKTSVVRAMMGSRGLDAYTLRLACERTDDRDLEGVFGRAAEAAPSILLFEDLDRVFPRKNETHSKISLQTLLNCMDGVATADGVIVVATANEPTALDPAILRRPGRFDRVVHFPNPSAELRRAYLYKLNAGGSAIDLDPVVSASEGFSFAQLREAYVVAGQRSFDRDGDITAIDLFAGVQSLRQGWAKAAERIDRRGFIPEAVTA